MLMLLKKNATAHGGKPNPPMAFETSNFDVVLIDVYSLTEQNLLALLVLSSVLSIVLTSVHNIDGH